MRGLRPALSCGWLRAGTALVISFMLIHVVGLDRWPAVTFDETLYSSPARSLATTGRLAAPVLSGILGLESRYFLQPPGHSLALALVYKVFGFGIFQTRMLGVVAGGLLVGTVYGVVFRLTGQIAPALAAGLLMWVDAPTILTARSGRFDSLGIFLVLLGLSLLMPVSGKARTRIDNRWLLFLSGGLCGAAIMVAPRVILAVGCLWLARLSVRPRGLRDEMEGLAPFLAGSVVAVLPWGIMIASDFNTFLAQFPPHAFGSVKRASGLGIAPLDWGHALSVFPGMAALVMLISRGIRWRGWGDEERIVLVFAALHTSLLLLIVSRSSLPLSYLLAYFTPAVYVVLGVCCSRLDVPSGERSHAFPWRILVLLVLVNWIGLSVARASILVAEWNTSGYRRLQRDFDQVVGPCTGTVIGDQNFYYVTLVAGCAFQHESILLNLNLPGERLEQLQANYRRVLSEKRDVLLALSDGIHPRDVLLPPHADRYRILGRLCFPSARGLLAKGIPTRTCANVYTDRPAQASQGVEARGKVAEPAPDSTGTRSLPLSQRPPVSRPAIEASGNRPLDAMGGAMAYL